MPTADITRVRNEERDLYGRNYWFSHQEELGHPSIEERSVTDLSGRCLHWMKALLAHRLPPARVLDLGASHGGFVALLEQAGYDATGLEISPWVVGFAREAFGVTMLEGPIEDQEISPGSFDIVVAFDVLEHFPDPLGTIGRCCELLSEDGILLLQTPDRPPEMPFDQLQNDDHPFARMLLPEHLFLFNRQALSTLLKSAGFSETVFEDAVFESDQFVIAGRQPLTRIDPTEIDVTLRGKSGSRLVLSLLEAAHGRNRLERDYLQADADRQGRQDQIDSLHRTLEQQSAERDAEHGRLTNEIRTLETTRDDLLDRQASLETQIDELREQHIQAETAAENDRRTITALEEGAARLQATIDGLEETIGTLRRDVEASEQAAAVQQNRIEELEESIHTLRQDVATAERTAVEKQNRIDELCDELDTASTTIESTQRHLADAEEELRRLEAAFEKQRRTLETYDSVVADHTENTAWLSERLRTVGALTDNFRQSRVYQLMVRSGRWRRFDDLMERALSDHRPPAHAAREADPEGVETWVIPSFHPISDEIRNRTIAVDLTSLLAGADNGGAKLVATELVRSLADLAPEWDFLLLTNDVCHHELAYLDRGNVRRRRTEVRPLEFTEILDEEPIALLFSPMTAPPFHDPRVPVVSVVHDLQVYTYPDFFTDDDRAERDRAFRNAVAWSDRVVTVSDYVRSTVLEHSSLPSDRVVTIHNGLADRLVNPDSAEVDEVLGRYGLEPEGYLLYPANFWSHKNHRMLLTAFSLFTHHNPATGLRLVLTGADHPDSRPIREAARQMGLDGRVVIPGFVPESDLASLLAGCRALVFPSLYEGFGIPVTEAMTVGRPVICSHAASLPEVAGDAALMVDPRKPEELVTAIERVSGDDDLVEDLISRGLQRVSALGGRKRMARAYIDLFESVLTGPRRYTNDLAGVFPDRWCGSGFVVSYGEGATELRLGLANGREDAVALSTTVGSFSRHIVLGPHQTLELTCRLPDQPGCLEFAVSSTFRPADRGSSPDTRHLGLRLASCHLSGRNETDLLTEPGGG
jgi:glycosyltransferase involved in cell wall biosynthesis/SAM-dependent methyltransferase